MSLGLHNLKPADGSHKRKKRVGRGNASGHGTYSGRGIKGQRARSGGKKGLKYKGLKANIRNVPKKRGFKSLKPKLEIVNLRDLERKCQAGDTIDPRVMLELGLIKNIKNGVKVLGEGKLSKKLTVKASGFSKSARDGIIKAGGRVELLH